MMQPYADYTHLKTISETGKAGVYQARHDATRRSVVIKELKLPHPSPVQLARFKQEYEIVRNLDIDGVIQILDVIVTGERFALVMEDCGGISLKQHIRGPMPVGDFLDLAVRIADALRALHEKNIIHQDVKPSNILYNPDTNSLKLTDFGISIKTAQAYEPTADGHLLVGTLAYMSPEQTGRMNCGVDSRTDFYSLGVTFYELLTGTVPFSAVEPIALIHAHIAKLPMAPHKVKPDIPEVLSAMVMRLLAKNAEERYQSGSGLVADLRQCRKSLGARGMIAPFALGQYDFSPKFNIPRSLVGRDRERGTLFQAFERVRQEDKGIVIVTGASGIGKSALVHEIHKPIAAQGGYFISGKYERLKQAEPYSAVIQALRGLVRQLLSESQDRLDSWRQKILGVLGINGKIITDIIGEMEAVIGKQPDIAELTPEATQNRFKLVLKHFVGALADRTHPLVIFLDDLQWADPASIELIQTLLSNQELTGFLLIGAYRDEAVPPHHPLQLALAALRASGIEVNTLALDPLDEAATSAFLVKFLRCPPHAAVGLSAAVYAKTLGNPFFIIQFLKRLHEQRYLRLEPGVGWQWDLDAIQQMQVTDNVVHFMAEKLADLPVTALTLIKAAACIGAGFAVETLAAAADASIDETVANLALLVEEQVVTVAKGEHYRFAHDRIQEAAYSLLTAEERTRLHHRIGRRMLANATDVTLPSVVFQIADQLNAAAALIQLPQERRRLAEINLQAGIRAKESTAYDAAAGYLQAGIHLLPEDAWQRQYALTYGLYSEQMESRFLARHFDEAERLFTIILANARDKIDRAKAYNTMVVLNHETRTSREAVTLGCTALKPFGIHLNLRMGPLRVLWELIKAKRKLKSVPLGDIPNLPLMKDKERIACENLMSDVGTGAFFVNPNLFAYMVLKSANITLKYGLAPNAPAMFACFAFLIENILGDYRLGFAMGEKALAVDQRLGHGKMSSRTYLNFAYFIQHWTRHAKHALPLFSKVYQLGIDYGDLTYACNGVVCAASTRLIIGDALDDLHKDMEKFRTFIDQAKNHFIAGLFEMQCQAIGHLRGQPADPADLSTSPFSEAAYLDKIRSEGNAHGLCFALLTKIRRLYLFGRYEEACRGAQEVHRNLAALMGTLHVPEHYFYYSLILIALLRANPAANRLKFKRIIARNLRKLAKWAKLCPENFLHKHDLVKAEWTALGRHPLQAAHDYRRAIGNARKNGYINDEALACERLADFNLHVNAQDEALIYLQRAYRCYGDWGAGAKQRDLDHRHRNLLGPIDGGVAGTTRRGHTTRPGENDADPMDLAMVLKVSQSISSDIVLDHLLKNIMHLSITHAGAQRGYLILEEQGELTVVAGHETDADGSQTMYPIALKDVHGVSRAIVHYVHRTLKPVILGNALNEGLFTQDPHVQQRLCKSILCMPIMNKGQRSGLLYMENNLAANAFTRERVEILGIVATQAAISLENARLFELATTDGLTRLYAHRYFQHLLDQEIDRSRRYGRSFSIVMMDIDNFKTFNDSHGHPMGDEALRQLARVLRTKVRAVDVAARYGGEEFILMLPETELQQALIVCENLRKWIERTPIPHQEAALFITVSMGVAVFPHHAFEKKALIQSADNALYDSKRNGKNRISVAQENNPQMN